MFKKLKIILCLSVILFSFFLFHNVQALTIGVSGNKFTVDGSAKFLTLISYFDALRAPNGTLDSDLAYLKSKNIDGIRIFPNWWGPYSTSNRPNDTLMNPSDGTLRSVQLAKLKTIIEKANSKGLVVDVSFAKEIEQLSVANYKKAIVSTVQALRNYPNIFYDIQNEYNCNGLSAGDILDIRNAIKGASSSALVSASIACGASPAEAVSIANSANLDIINYHDDRSSNWYSQTGTRINSITPVNKPIYFGEPEKWSSGSSLIADNFTTAITQAKSAGAAAWTFHTRAAYNLGASSMQSSLNTGVEKNFLDSFSSELAGVVWGSSSSGGAPNSPTGPVIPPIPGEVEGICGDDVYQAGARAKDPTAIGAECRDKVWFQRNVNKALSCSSNFTFRGSSATQWKNWSENAVEKVVRACDGDNVANADKILSALEGLWSSCLPGGPPRKGISCVCSTDKDVEGTSCEEFIRDIGPPVINSISPTTAGSFQPITVIGKFLGNQIVLASISGSPIQIPVEPGVNANYLTFEVPDIDDGEYSVISSGSNGSSVESIKLTILQGAPFPATVNLPVPSRGLPTDLGQMIGAIFIWSLGLIGLVIFVRFFYAGFLWFTAAANTANVSQAKEIMKNAVYGTLVLFSAWLILNTINPDLVSGTLNLPGLPATTSSSPVEGVPPPGAPPSGPTSCNQKFTSVNTSAGCATTSDCTDVSSYTSTHGCESNSGVCLLSSQAAPRAMALITSFNTLSAGKGCSLKISSALQVNNGPSVSKCHKPNNPKSGTCADFNIIGDHNTCSPYFYKAAKDTASVVSFLDEYVPACKTPSATGGNIHVNF